MSKLKWELKEHYEKPGWGVGDYDEYYEIVNERGDALQATDYEGLEQIADALNGFEGNLRITTALEINQHCDNQMLKAENDHLKAENSKLRKQAKIELIWELIEGWQDARDIGEDIHAPKFSFNDIEADLYEWMEKIEPGSCKEKYSGSAIRRPTPGVQLNCISPEARDLLGKIMEAWEPHYEGLKAGNKDYEPGFYGFAYWLVRWSGLIQPLTKKL